MDLVLNSLMEQERFLISISNQNVHWSDHLPVIQKVGLEVNYLRSCFVSIAAGKIWEVFYFVLRGYKQSFKTKMLTIIPKESPAFAIEHAISPRKL